MKIVNGSILLFLTSFSLNATEIYDRSDIIRAIEDISFAITLNASVHATNGAGYSLTGAVVSATGGVVKNSTTPL